MLEHSGPFVQPERLARVGMGGCRPHRWGPIDTAICVSFAGTAIRPDALGYAGDMTEAIPMTPAETALSLLFRKLHPHLEDAAHALSRGATRRELERLHL